MSKVYMPQLGDVVKFKGMNMVVIHQESRETMAHLSYDRTYYLLEESLVDSSTPVPTEDLLFKCMKVDIKPQMSRIPRFIKIADNKYDIQQIPYTKILKKD